MLYTTDSNFVTGLDGRRYSLTGSLIKSPGKPAAGWRASLPVKGQNLELWGRTPLEVYNAAVIALGRNGLAVKNTDIWLNLNIQWMNRTPVKYHAVPVAELLHIAKVREPGKNADDKRRRSYKPSDWGKWAWGWLNIFLARDDYHYRDFLTQLTYVLDLLNPDTNPEIGCAECFRDFTIMMEKVRKSPGMTREEARRWLVAAHNQVNKKLGKRVLTYEEAARLAFWI